MLRCDRSPVPGELVRTLRRRIGEIQCVTESLQRERFRQNAQWSNSVGNLIPIDGRISTGNDDDLQSDAQILKSLQRGESVHLGHCVIQKDDVKCLLI